MIGSTYTSDELITGLYLENLYLKQKLSKPIEPSTVARPSKDEVQRDSKYHVAREYIRATESSGNTGRHLVLANEYPNYGSEYGNGFVHRRVEYYKRYGNTIDIMAFGRRQPNGIYNYKGSYVLTGYVKELVALLTTRKYKSVSVHFLNHDMWNALSPFLKDIDLYVYLHGYEVRSWVRRAGEYSTPAALQGNIRKTHLLQAFWKEVIQHPLGPKKFIFVSKWWKEAASEDMQLTFPESRSRIVHNLIDTELFDYIPKDPSQRFRILWIRSASARNYANDVAIECLEILKKTKYWQKMHVTIVGDGQYFHEFSDHFGMDSNVIINQRFVDQEQIAIMHKTHGLFLVPTRLDSQGVSRDEAMSSGLVPVTNAVAAVPEFVDTSTAILAENEDSEMMAQGIINLFENPKLFSEMSERTAERARSQCSEHQTVLQEASLMGMNR